MVRAYFYLLFATAIIFTKLHVYCVYAPKDRKWLEVKGVALAITTGKRGTPLARTPHGDLNKFGVFGKYELIFYDL